MRAKFYFEALGNPKETVNEFLNKILKDIQEFEGFTLESSNIEEPIEREIEAEPGKKVKMWSSYLEVVGEFKDFPTLLDFILMFSPSHIEVENIKKMELSKEQLNDLLNSVSNRVIQLSMVINDLIARNQMLIAALERVSPRMAQQFKQQEPQPPSAGQ